LRAILKFTLGETDALFDDLTFVLDFVFIKYFVAKGDLFDDLSKSRIFQSKGSDLTFVAGFVFDSILSVADDGSLRKIVLYRAGEKGCKITKNKKCRK
jgi:hypothetical protein